jgi:hypothetical protein
MSAQGRTLKLLRLTGIVGIITGIAMSIADISLLYSSASGYESDAVLLTIPMWRLLLGHYLGVLMLPFYLIAVWHLYEGIKPGGARRCCGMGAADLGAAGRRRSHPLPGAKSVICQTIGLIRSNSRVMRRAPALPLTSAAHARMPSTRSCASQHVATRCSKDVPAPPDDAGLETSAALTFSWSSLLGKSRTLVTCRLPHSSRD